MNILLNPSDRDRAQRLVDAGRFSDLEEVLHAGLEALEDHESWLQYAGDRINHGVKDADAGDVISGEDFIAQLRTGRLKRA